MAESVRLQTSRQIRVIKSQMTICIWQVIQIRVAVETVGGYGKIFITGEVIQLVAPQHRTNLHGESSDMLKSTYI